MKTFVAKELGTKREWVLVDADGKIVGRLAASIARVLRGKHRPDFTPHVDTGDFVVVINAAKVKLSGRKEDLKMYQQFSGFRGGLKKEPARVIRQKHPDRLIKQAVKGMLPKNHLSRWMMSRLKVYAGSTHPHAAQAPRVIELN